MADGRGMDVNFKLPPAEMVYSSEIQRTAMQGGDDPEI